MTVETILKKKGHNVFTIRPEHSLADAANLLSNKGIGVAVVCDGKGRVQGVLSERDIVKAIAAYAAGALQMPVRNVMSSPAITCSLRDSAKAILEVMTERRIRHLPVIADGELIGIVSIGDAVQARLSDAQIEMSVLRDFAVMR